jgi:hypothetical protein
MHEIERAINKYNSLQIVNEKYAVDHLRARADVAEAIRDCYKADITRKEVAAALGIDPTRVTRLVYGNYKATEATVPRSETNYQRRGVPAPDDPEAPAEAHTERDTRPATCLYCDREAKFSIVWDNGKTVNVCIKHKPPGE